jgi:hypothetical protein
MVPYRYGALHVLERSADTDAVQRRLRQLDPNLFLERQVTLDGEQVWCVMCTVGSERPPLCVFEWRDPETGAPIPVLSHGIVDRMAAMERDPFRLAQRVREQNTEFSRRQRERFAEQVREMAEERRKAHLSHYVIPRSPGLAAARRRQRRQGHNV